MSVRLTRRRALGACLLLFGTVLLGLGAWYESPAAYLVGAGCWFAALLGIGVLLVQRANVVLQAITESRSEMQRLVAKSRFEVQQLAASEGKSIWLLRKCLARIEDLEGDRKRYATDTDRLFAGLDTISSQLSSERTHSVTWRQEHSAHTLAFQRQFGDFVASVSEWIALAEAQAKQSVAELSKAEALALDKMSKSLLHRLDGVDSRLSSLQRAAESDPATELAETISQTVTLAVSKARAIDREGLVKAVQHKLDTITNTVTATHQVSTRLNASAAADSEQIKAIAKSVDGILPAQRSEIARAKIESVKEVEAILQLQTFLTPERPMPLLGGWAMEPVSMLGVVTELVTREPELVLECGSGTSTLWIAKALKRIGKGRVVSLEHLKEHHAATSRALLEAGLDGWAAPCFAPLRTHRIEQEQFKWYDLKRLQLPDRSVDFLLIDGPPEATGRLARYPALPLLARLLADRAVVVLDDCNRQAEVEEVERWLQQFPGLQEVGSLGERTKIFTYSSSEQKQSATRLRAL